MTECREGQWLAQRLRGWSDRPALIWREQSWSYARLSAAVDDWRGELERRGVEPGSTLALCGDYSPRLCTALIAAFLNRNIIVPLASAPAHRRERLMETAEIRFAIEFDGNDRPRVSDHGRRVAHPLLRRLGEQGTAGLGLFSSGSTGESKASVLDLDRLLQKFQATRPAYRTLVFLLVDHIGGINTLFHALSHGGTIVTARDRSPENVCAAIAAHRIQLLPTTPT